VIDVLKKDHCVFEAIKYKIVYKIYLKSLGILLVVSLNVGDNEFNTLTGWGCLIIRYFRHYYCILSISENLIFYVFLSCQDIQDSLGNKYLLAIYH
jgi:hypothetical protein